MARSLASGSGAAAIMMATQSWEFGTLRIYVAGGGSHLLGEPPLELATAPVRLWPDHLYSPFSLQALDNVFAKALFVACSIGKTCTQLPCFQLEVTSTLWRCWLGLSRSDWCVKLLSVTGPLLRMHLQVCL
jgi:hypothetical protein